MRGDADLRVRPQPFPENGDDAEDVRTQRWFPAGQVRLTDAPQTGLASDGLVVGNLKGPVLRPVVLHAARLAEHAVPIADRVDRKGQVRVITASRGEPGSKLFAFAIGRQNIRHELLPHQSEPGILRKSAG